MARSPTTSISTPHMPSHSGHTRRCLPVGAFSESHSESIMPALSLRIFFANTEYVLDALLFDNAGNIEVFAPGDDLVICVEIEYGGEWNSNPALVGFRRIHSLSEYMPVGWSDRQYLTVVGFIFSDHALNLAA